MSPKLGVSLLPHKLWMLFRNLVLSGAPFILLKFTSSTSCQSLNPLHISNYSFMFAYNAAAETITRTPSSLHKTTNL